MVNRLDGTDPSDRKRKIGPYQDGFYSASDSFVPSKKCSSDDTDGWSKCHHRDFVEAIYRIGLRNCSPSIILEHMSLTGYDINGERIKSHLQKYRNNQAKALHEFMSSYDTSLSLLHAAINELRLKNGSETGLWKTATAAVESKTGLLLGGELAAYLTVCSTLSEFDNNNSQVVDPSSDVGSLEECMQNPGQILNRFTQVQLPRLTEKEKKTALGATFCYIMGLFLSLKQHISEKRKLDNQINTVKKKIDQSSSFHNEKSVMSRDILSPSSVRLSSARAHSQTIPRDVMDSKNDKKYAYEPPVSTLRRSMSKSTRITSFVRDYSKDVESRSGFMDSLHPAHHGLPNQSIPNFGDRLSPKSLPFSFVGTRNNYYVYEPPESTWTSSSSHTLDSNCSFQVSSQTEPKNRISRYSTHLTSLPSHRNIPLTQQAISLRDHSVCDKLSQRFTECDTSTTPLSMSFDYGAFDQIVNSTRMVQESDHELSSLAHELTKELSKADPSESNGDSQEFSVID